MPNYLRPRIPGAAILFTVAFAERGYDLLVSEIGLLRSAFNATLTQRPVAIDALVELPNHLDAVLALPKGDSDYALRWRQIETRFSRVLTKGRMRPSHETRAERGIWQRRFWEHDIPDAEDYRVHMENCWWNPVKHGFVERAGDWPHSSLHRDICAGRAGRSGCSNFFGYHAER